MTSADLQLELAVARGQRVAIGQRQVQLRRLPIPGTRTPEEHVPLREPSRGGVICGPTGSSVAAPAIEAAHTISSAMAVCTTTDRRGLHPHPRGNHRTAFMRTTSLRAASLRGRGALGSIHPARLVDPAEAGLSRAALSSAARPQAASVRRGARGESSRIGRNMFTRRFITIPMLTFAPRSAKGRSTVDS
jgi:hypothetical protein